LTFANVEFTPREFQTMQLASQGWTNRDVAKMTGTTEGTTKNYMKAIYDKTGMGNRVELALWYLAHGGTSE
jgi:DNA-binding NarL/FixJ family response regulator